MTEHAPSVTQEAIIARTRRWVEENFLYARPDWKLGVDDPMLDAGVIDSVGVIELVEFLQDSFELRIGDDELTVNNLGSLRAVAEFVHRRHRANGNARPTRPSRDR